MNKVMLLGRMARDPEVRFTQGAEPMAVNRFAIAVDRPVRRDSNERNVDFINCVCFGKRAETIGQYFRKGSRIAITGRLQVSEYTDREGNKRYSTDVVVDEFDFCESRGDNGASGYTPAPKPAQSSQPDGFYSVDSDTEDEDLPF